MRKLEKERIKFVLEKRNVALKRDRLIETLKKERVQLQDRLNAVTTGRHAQREIRVSIYMHI